MHKTTLKLYTFYVVNYIVIIILHKFYTRTTYYIVHTTSYIKIYKKYNILMFNFTHIVLRL